MNAFEFLHQHGQTPQQLSSETALELLHESAKAGLHAQGGLPMVLSYLAGSLQPPQEGVCAVMDAGGTNLRTGLARFREGRCTLENVQTIPMPASGGETLSAEALYGRIAQQLERLGDTERVGCCFSYLVDIERSLDGQLREWCKEVRCPDAVGAYVGKSLMQALPGCSHVAVLNDSTAALLGAQTRLGKDRRPFVGLIMGTGVNICYAEQRSNTAKLEADIRCPDMIISTEAGEFRGITPGTFEAELIASTDDPASAQAEKQCSGGYLAQIIHFALCRAFREGLLTKEPEDFTLGDVSRFLECPVGEFAGLQNASDLEFARDICGISIHRSAKIGAVLTAEFVLRSATTCKQVRIVAEGSLFWKMHGFRELFCRELTALTEPRGVSFSIEQAENACLEGAALAAFAPIVQ